MDGCSRILLVSGIRHGGMEHSMIPPIVHRPHRGLFWRLDAADGAGCFVAPSIIYQGFVALLVIAKLSSCLCYILKT